MFTGLSSAISPPDVDSVFIQDLFGRLHQMEVPFEGLKDEIEAYYLNLMLNLGNVGTANFLFYGVQLIGVYLMFRLNRIGFVLYTVAQLGLAVTPALFGGFNTFGLISLGVVLFWNLIWVGLYATQLKYFRKSTSDETQTH